MNQDFTHHSSSKSSLSPSQPGVPIYTHPDDVAADPQLTAAEKRALLASWISDARAVVNAPALRRLDSGAVVAVDAILRALRALDEPSLAEPDARNRLPPSPGPRGVIAKAVSTVRSRYRTRDDDDDPPPAPAGLAVPFHPTFVAAQAA